ncbi:MAG: DMT family transporter [Chloroflexi bacterium]|nr:DMT family transporter [Chloroflexota bacterium]
MTRTRALAYAGVLFATVVWGTLHPVGKIALGEVSALQLVMARTVLTALALSAFLLARGQAANLWMVMRYRWRIVVLLGSLSFLLSSGLSMTGLSMMPASINSLLANTSPLMLAVGLVALTGVAPRPRIVLGLGLGFAGVVILTGDGADTLGTAGVIGALLSLAGSACWAAYTGIGRRELARHDPLVLTTGCAIVGAVPLLGLGAITGQIAALSSVPPTTLWLLAYAGVFGTALTYALWMTSLAVLSATSVAAFQYVIPLTAVTLAVLLLGEPLTVGLIVGGIAILGGVLLAQEGTTAAAERD